MRTSAKHGDVDCVRIGVIVAGSDPDLSCGCHGLRDVQSERVIRFGKAREQAVGDLASHLAVWWHILNAQGFVNERANAPIELKTTLDHASFRSHLKGKWATYRQRLMP